MTLAYHFEYLQRYKIMRRFESFSPLNPQNYQHLLVT